MYNTRPRWVAPYQLMHSWCICKNNWITSEFILPWSSYISHVIWWYSIALAALQWWGHNYVDHRLFHCWKNVIIVIKFAWLAALEVVLLTTSSVGNDKNVLKMMIFFYFSDVGTLTLQWHHMSIKAIHLTDNLIVCSTTCSSQQQKQKRRHKISASLTLFWGE